MKAIVIDNFGGPEVLSCRDAAVPEINDDELLIRVRAAGVNPVDWKIREGYITQLFPHQLPLIPGWDLAGVVETAGKNVTRFSKGDEVYGYMRPEIVQYGSFAEYAPAAESMLSRKPGNLDFTTAATIPLATLTAWQALIQFGDLQSGESVFITAGAGGVGGFAIQIAKHHGAMVCAAASARNHDYLRALGADHVIDYQQDEIEARVHDFVADGVDLVFDCTGHEDVAVNFTYVKKSTGRVATINGLLNTLPELEKNAIRYGVKAGLVVVEPNAIQLAEITQLIESGAISPLPVESFPLEQARAALQKSEAGHVRGKLALVIG